MKSNAFLIAVIVLCSSAYNYTQSAEQNLYGKWKIAAESLDKTTEAIIHNMRKNNPAAADRMQANPDAAKKAVAAIEVEYKADKTYQITTPDGVQRGKWELADDQKSLVTYTAKGSARKNSILELTPARLRLYNIDRGDTTLFVRPQ